MELRQSPIRTAKERSEKRRKERAERKAERKQDAEQRKAERHKDRQKRIDAERENDIHEQMEHAADSYAEQQRRVAEDNEMIRRAHIKEMEKQRLQKEKLKGYTPKQLEEMRRKSQEKAQKEEMKRMEQAEAEEIERRENEKAEERESYRRELDERKARRDKEIDDRMDSLDELNGVVREEDDDGSDDVMEDAEDESEEEIEEEAINDRESVICPECGDPIDMNDPRGHIMVNDMPTCVSCAKKLMGMPEDCDPFADDTPITINDDVPSEESGEESDKDADPGDGKDADDNKESQSALDILNENPRMNDDTVLVVVQPAPDEKESGFTIPSEEEIERIRAADDSKGDDEEKPSENANPDADDDPNENPDEDDDSEQEETEDGHPSIIPPYRRKKKAEPVPDEDSDPGDGMKKRGRKKKKNYSPDPDSFGERLRRWKLIHFDNYVILRTLYRDDRTGEFVRESTLIPRKELPHDATACTGEKHIYCLDLIKDSEWYYRNHYKNINLMEYQFTASDAALYMQSNKIDNALAVHWVTPTNTKDIMKYLLLVVGVLVVLWLVMTRIGS